MAKGETYDQFVDKFKPKLTTDDCYTPAAVYDAVAGWVAKEYKLDQSDFVRPFWPGGDYESYDYPDGCVVVDNPPFSILSKIVRFYDSRKIRFFLWAPALTLFGLRSAGDFAFLPVSVSVTYANGAVVSTSFVTNLEPGCVRTSSELSDSMRLADAIGKTPTLPKYAYDKHVISAAYCNKIAGNGVDMYIPSSQYEFIRRLDVQKDAGKGIYGGGFILSDSAADYFTAKRLEAERNRLEAERNRLEAERQRAIVWELSDREKDIVRKLSE